MLAIASAVLSLLSCRLRSRISLELAILALRHQLRDLRRQRPSRPLRLPQILSVGVGRKNLSLRVMQPVDGLVPLRNSVRRRKMADFPELKSLPGAVRVRPYRAEAPLAKFLRPTAIDSLHRAHWDDMAPCMRDRWFRSIHRWPGSPIRDCGLRWPCSSSCPRAPRTRRSSRTALLHNSRSRRRPRPHATSVRASSPCAAFPVPSFG